MLFAERVELGQKLRRRQFLAVDGDRIAALLQSAFMLPPDVVKAANEAMALTGAANERE